MSDESVNEINELIEVEVVVVVFVGSTGSSLNPGFISWSDVVVLVSGVLSEGILELISGDFSTAVGINVVEDGSELSLNITTFGLGITLDVVVSDESSNESLELWKVKRVGAISISSSGSSSDPSSVGSGDGVVLVSGVFSEGSSKLSW